MLGWTCDDSSESEWHPQDPWPGPFLIARDPLSNASICSQRQSNTRIISKIKWNYYFGLLLLIQNLGALRLKPRSINNILPLTSGWPFSLSMPTGDHLLPVGSLFSKQKLKGNYENKLKVWVDWPLSFVPPSYVFCPRPLSFVPLRCVFCPASYVFCHPISK